MVSVLINIRPSHFHMQLIFVQVIKVPPPFLSTYTDGKIFFRDNFLHMCHIVPTFRSINIQKKACLPQFFKLLQKQLHLFHPNLYSSVWHQVISLVCILACDIWTEAPCACSVNGLAATHSVQLISLLIVRSPRRLAPRWGFFPSWGSLGARRPSACCCKAPRRRCCWPTASWRT